MAKHFRCKTYEARPKTKTIRPATMPKTYQPNKVVGIDLIYIPAVGGGYLVPMLAILDWGNNFQMVEIVQNKKPMTMWRKLWSCWAKIFGLPEVIVCDVGCEFAAEFIRMASNHGVITYKIGSHIPWQNGKMERHGVQFKELLEKACHETVITDENELKFLMQEIESIENRYTNRSRSAPIQR